MAKATNILRKVQGDFGESDVWTLRDRQSGNVIDLSNCTGVTMHFRKRGTTTVLTTLNLTIVPPSTAGQVRLVWPTGALNVDPGFYEGEIVLALTGGGTKTVYDLVQFQVRQDVQ